MINKPSDLFSYKNDQEKEEIQDQLRSHKLQLGAKLGLILLGAMFLFAIGAVLYLYFTYFR